eukprot:TRINITY_DN4347_c0_g1_i2.p1 TRINITY_DN4347_c0_g1~~TRINITY_DN4347_c0_g1_i2.p1  ORF type:complete len:122 (+),score=27.28 TRINITY_DN4347_c0_g1_i2:49-366(+)
MGNEVTKNCMSGTPEQNGKKLKDWQKKWEIDAKQMKIFEKTMKNLKMRDGKIHLEDYVRVHNKLGVDTVTATHLFNAADMDGSGSIDEDEMLEYYGICWGNFSYF